MNNNSDNPYAVFRPIFFTYQQQLNTQRVYINSVECFHYVT